jgi:peptidyl-prolyl cis-trans isomerase A (cyclophilin A)
VFTANIILLSACGHLKTAPVSPVLPLVSLTTEFGKILIEVDVNNAPISGNNFLAYVRGGHFSNLSFYRAVNHTNDNHKLKIGVLQGGIDTNFDDSFEPKFGPIAHESTTQTGLRHLRGAVSFARGDLGTAQTEFFISTMVNPALDAGGLRHPDKLGFAVFGKVIEGMETVDKIAAMSTNKKHLDPYVKGQVLDHPVTVSKVAIVH